jgi:flavin-dependent dehydrogenase
VERFDAVVVGGGPAGASAALFLVRAGWSVALVERKSFPRRKVCGEYLSPTNWPLLDALGLLPAFLDLAGPPVRHVALFAGRRRVRADLPVAAAGAAHDGARWGRALSREQLDTLLVGECARRGVAVYQPARCVAIAADAGGHVCRLEAEHGGASIELAAGAVVAAHGSWDVGPLATQRRPAPARPSDLIAFKAHFLGAALDEGLMPLVSFSGGYGGMVHCDGGRVSLSCCIRRDRLERLSRGGEPAGCAVLGHILESCPVLRPVLDSGALDGAWLSAGPIQPGLRRCFADGVFLAGNVAGEAHPVIAEGISMAMQSAWLLADALSRRTGQLHDPAARIDAARAYQAAWRRAFQPRIRAAAVVAHWATRPPLAAAMMPAFKACPRLLALGARLSGKARMVAPRLRTNALSLAAARP